MGRMLLTSTRPGVVRWVLPSGMRTLMRACSGHGIGIIGGFHFPGTAEGHAFALLEAALGGHVVQTQNDVLGRHDDGTAVGGREDVVGAHHEHAAFDLRFHGKRDVHGHLVTVEVGVEGRANERMQLDGLTFDQLGFKGLNTETVQRRSTVEHHRVFVDHLFRGCPTPPALDCSTIFLALLIVEARPRVSSFD